MAYDDIREALADKISEASAQIKVYSHFKFTLEPFASQEFQDLFVTNDKIIMAHINRNNFQDFQANEDNRVLRRHEIYITVYYSFQDTAGNTSEDAFNELLTEICEVFNSNRDLDNSVLCVSLPELTNVDDIGNLGNRKIPLHRCIMKLYVDEVLNV